MSPTLRRARVLHSFAELGAASAGLFSLPLCRRRLAVVEVEPVSPNGHLPEHFHQLAGLRPYDREAA